LLFLNISETAIKGDPQEAIGGSHPLFSKNQGVSFWNPLFIAEEKYVILTKIDHI
jgi:hypothetical protein